MRLRPLLPADAPAVHEAAVASFEDLARRSGEDVPPRPDPGAAHLRIRRLASTDPGGAWLAEEDGTVAGAALALMREGLWGLSLLVVRPEAQSRGLGRALLERVLAYGREARGHVILASNDPRALRAYARAGLAFHPTATAAGVPRDVASPAEVRPLEPGDRAMTDAVGRHVRGAPHGDDLDALAAGGAEVLVVPGRGYAAHREGEVKLLAAADDGAARLLLGAVLARTPEGRTASASWLTAAQSWAVGVVLDAGLDLKPDGGLFLRGDTGAFTPYLPSGAYL
jgi:GNAT superfamily N-acetyltransferase